MCNIVFLVKILFKHLNQALHQILQWKLKPTYHHLKLKIKTKIINT